MGRQAGDDQDRPLTRLLRAEHPVPAHRDPLRSPRSPGLGDIDLAARGIDPHRSPHARIRFATGLRPNRKRPCPLSAQ